MPASPLVNSPPATTSLAGSSHHLPLQLHLNRQWEKKTNQTNTGEKHSIEKLCAMCTVTSRLARWNGLPGAGWTARTEMKQWEAENEADRKGQTCHVWGQWVLQDRTQWHTLYCYEKSQKHCRQLNIYWLSMCWSGYPPCIGSNSVFVQTSGRGERGKRVEWQIMNTLCLAFDKYLLGTSSIPFHFTNKLQIHWLLHYFRMFLKPSVAPCQCLS